MEIELSVVLLNYNSFELLGKSLLEVINHIPPEGVEVVVVDNGSTDEQFLNNFEWWKKATLSKPVRFVKIPENRGFGGGMNYGVLTARGKNILLLSNDVMVKDINLFKDVINLCDGNDKVLIGGRIIDWDSGWNTFEATARFYTIPYCEGYALAMSKKAWEELGGFDEEYCPYDYEDMDLSMTAMQHNFMLVQLDHEYMFHMSGQTIKEDREKRVEITRRNREYFKKKWEKLMPEILDDTWKK
jgi:GT2 family glycosyltransferase